MKRWSGERVVQLPVRLTPETDEWIWSRYALTLEINRHCAEAFDDDTVSEHLQHVRENTPLLWFFEH